MRTLIVGLGAILLFIGGCVTGTAASLEAKQPDRSFFSGEQPGLALTGLAGAAEQTVGRPELVDHGEGRLVISNLHPVCGTILSRLVVRVVAADGGSTVKMWTSGVQPIVGGSWADRLWAAYAARLVAAGVSYRSLLGPEAMPLVSPD